MGLIGILRGPQGPPGPVTYKAGTATLLATGVGTVAVTFVTSFSAVPIVTLAFDSATTAAPMSSTNTGKYLDVESRTVSGFTIALRNVNGGGLEPPSHNVVVNWHAFLPLNS